MSQATRIGATIGASLILALSACTGAKADTLGVHTVSWPETGLRYPRTAAEAFHDTRSGSVSGPYRRPHRARHVLAVALLALIAWGVIA